MATTNKKDLHGNFVEKQDLGKYSKSLGVSSLVQKGNKDLHAKLFK